MKTAVSLIESVLWPFLIYNIVILKKDLVASFLGILFPLTLVLGWSGDSVSHVYQLNSHCHI